MDHGHDLDYVKRLIDKRLIPLGIAVDITLKSDSTVMLTATKRVGNSVQHANIHGSSLIDAIWKLIKYIEKEIEEWIEKELY